MKNAIESIVKFVKFMAVIAAVVTLSVTVMNKPNPNDGIHVELAEANGVGEWVGEKLWRASESWQDWDTTNLGVAYIAKANIRGRKATAVGLNNKWYLVSYN